MVQGQIPEGPWDMVATDLFQWDGADYLLIVDYYSRFIEFCTLPNTSSSMVIIHTKSIFARHGGYPSQYEAIMVRNFQQWNTANLLRNGVLPMSLLALTTLNLMD